MRSKRQGDPKVRSQRWLIHTQLKLLNYPKALTTQRLITYNSRNLQHKVPKLHCYHGHCVFIALFCSKLAWNYFFYSFDTVDQNSGRKLDMTLVSFKQKKKTNFVVKFQDVENASTFIIGLTSLKENDEIRKMIQSKNLL